MRLVALGLHLWLEPGPAPYGPHRKEDGMSTPPFSYFGGKTMLADRIVALLPPHQHYVEPFAGSLAVLLAKPRSQLETVNDLDRDIMTFWRVLRDQPDDLARVCALTPHSRAEFVDAYDREGCADLERARRVWVRLTQSRTGSLGPRGWRFAVEPAGRAGGGVPGDMAGYLKRMPAAASRLLGVSLECRPALELIEAYGSCTNVLIYADPPYLGSTRGGANYRTDMTGEDEHRALAEALAGCRATVVLSGYDSPLYADLYDGWHVHRISTQTGQGGARADRTEVLWSNRPSGQQAGLFDLLEGGAA